jgi:hypothetical protein
MRSATLVTGQIFSLRALVTRLDVSAISVAIGMICSLAVAWVATPIGRASGISNLHAAAATAADRERITIVGTRRTQGNAVDCPQVRTDDGTDYTVSYLAPAIKIGDRISVTGFFAHVVKCRGEVLFAEKVDVLP